MRWTIRVIIVVAVLWVGYAAWPVWALYDLVHAVENRDSAAVAQRVNFPAVRVSLAEQIVATYLKLTGRDLRLGRVERAVALSAVTSIADPIVAKLISAEALVELLNKGWPASALREDAPALHGLGSNPLGSLWQVFIHADYGLRRFELAVPMTAAPPHRFKLQFRLTTWRWKLSAIQLPEELRVRLAQELIRLIDRK